MNTIYKWGTPLPETDRVEITPYTPMFDKQWGEMLYEIQFEPREPTAHDYELVVNQTVYEFGLTCPEAEVRYVEAITGSPHYLRIQFIHHGNSLTLAAIGAALLAVLGLILSKIVYIAIAAVIVMAGYALYKYIKPADYQCPICGEIFDSYETLVAHMEYAHPGAPIPDRPPAWEDYLKWGLIGGGLILGAAVLIPAISDVRRRRRK